MELVGQESAGDDHQNKPVGHNPTGCIPESCWEPEYDRWTFSWANVMTTRGSHAVLDLQRCNSSVEVRWFVAGSWSADHLAEGSIDGPESRAWLTHAVQTARRGGYRSGTCL
jgi:hypothetical protein